MSIRVENVSKRFSTTKGEEVFALDDINFTQSVQEFICIIGPTGCGKTTLLRLIAGLDTPTSGAIYINNKWVKEPDGKTTLVFQQYSLFPWLNVIDNVAFGLELKGKPKTERYNRAKRFLELVGLNNFAHAYPYELSGGMQQRVAIIRALVLEPEILLMDEPFGALDEKTRHYLQDELLKIWANEKKAIIFVTHNIDEAIYLADRIIIMSGQPGKIIKDLKVDLKRPRDRLAKEFVDLHIEVRRVLELVIKEKKEEK